MPLENQKEINMKLMSFNEINDLENGQQISALQGTVKKVFDQKTDIGQYGQWWLQSFILTDEHGVELQCTWSCEDTVNELEGKTILIEAGRDKKDQLAGVKKEIKNKGGKRYETVKLDDRCTIRKVDEANQVKITHPEQRYGISPPGEIDAPSSAFTPDWPETAPISNPKPKHSMLDEQQRAIIRQHSQSMALEVLKLKIGINQLILEDLTPSKLKTLADYFDEDVLKAAQ